MNYYLIAGEASGDLHASNLMKEIKKLDKNANFRFWGGELMQKVGGELVKHYKELDFMGFIEVVKNLKTILKNLKDCKNDILNYKPDAVVLVDYPGFNLRIAEFLHQHSFKTYYYISPQVWAWKKNRVHKICKYSDRVFTILPFEGEFYKGYGYDVDYVGHPLLDAIKNRNDSDENTARIRKDLSLGEKKIIALLPGSRMQEVKKMLPLMLNQLKNFPDYQFVIAAAPHFNQDFFTPFSQKFGEFKVVYNRTYDVLQVAHTAMVTSGTATLETALFKVPEVVCYKGSKVSYHIAKKLVKIKYISLVNLIFDKEVVRELIQNELNDKLLKMELGKLLHDKNYRSEMINTFESLIRLLGGGGASEKTAQLLMSDLKKDV